MNQAKQAFYTYVQDVRLIQVNAQNLRDEQEHLALAVARLCAGIGIPLDVVMAETAVAEAVLNLAVANNNMLLARTNLAMIMGIDPRTPIQPPIPVNLCPTDDVNGLINIALKQRPEVAQAQANIEANQYALGVAKTNNAPSISGFVELFNRTGAGFANGSAATVGATLTWLAFDSGQTAGLVKAG